MQVDKNTVSNWLSTLNLEDPRAWLADEIGVERRTVDSWFSTRGFPPWAIKAIERLQRDTNLAPEGKILTTFTTDEFEMIEQARHIVGDPPRPKFYYDCIIAASNDIIEAEKAGKIEPLKPAQDEDSLRVAEEPAKFGAAKKRGKHGA